MIEPSRVAAAPTGGVVTARFPDEYHAHEIGKDVLEIERQVKAKHPEVKAVFVRPKDSRRSGS